MSGEDVVDSRLRAAIGGDRDALEGLLFERFDRLAGHVAARLPEDVRSVLSAEDVVQDACIVAFQRISELEPRGEGPFFAWLSRIAENCLMDAVKSLRAAKRGGGRAALAEGDGQDVIPLLEMLAAHSWTPSRSTARREDMSALEVALQALPSDYREALRLRYLEAQPVAAISERMQRSEGAVHMLLNRAVQVLRSRMAGT